MITDYTRHLVEQRRLHLTVSDRGWALILRGMPLCAPTTLGNCLDVARQQVGDYPYLPVWDADRGDWAPNISDKCVG